MSFPRYLGICFHIFNAVWATPWIGKIFGFGLTGQAVQVIDFRQVSQQQTCPSSPQAKQQSSFALLPLPMRSSQYFSMPTQDQHNRRHPHHVLAIHEI